MASSESTQLVIIQASPLCNINCSYCYLPDRGSSKRISTETLRAIFEKLFASDLVQDGTSIVWHAGEPLVLPISFYEGALDLCSKANVKRKKISHGIQTNGTLINQQWCEFIKKADIRIGVSLDGPQEIHDAHRTDRRGKGTFDRVVRGIELLQRNGIRFHIIAVLSRASIEHPEEIWRFLVERGIEEICLNPEEVEGINTTSSLQVADAEAKYSRFLRHILQHWDAEARKRYVREFHALIGHILHGTSDVCSTENTPLAILNFDVDGNFSTFSPELLGMRHERYGTFAFGNVHRDEIRDLLHNERFLTCKGDIDAGIDECRRTCEYFCVCGGGAPSNKLFENGRFDSSETLACRLRRKTLTDVVLPWVEGKLSDHTIEVPR